MQYGGSTQTIGTYFGLLGVLLHFGPKACGRSSLVAYRNHDWPEAWFGDLGFQGLGLGINLGIGVLGFLRIGGLGFGALGIRVLGFRGLGTKV